MLKSINRSRIRILDGLMKIWRRSNADDAGNQCPDNNEPKKSGSGKPDPKVSHINSFETSWLEAYSDRIASGYLSFPVVVAHGEGIYVWDDLGNKYMDFTSGDGAVNIGHCNEKVAQTLEKGMRVLTQSTKRCQTRALAAFACTMTKTFGYDKVLALNTGNEAVEAAVKIARIFGYTKKRIPLRRAKILVPEKSQWGTSIAAVATNERFSRMFGPVPEGFEVIPFNDIEALREKVVDPYVCGFLVEPIQTTAGGILPDPCYLRDAYDLCLQNNVLFMADEVQVGLGRCGAYVCSHLFNVRPHVLILGKALSGGFMPVSAVLADSLVMDCIKDIRMYSTYGGFPLGCYATIFALNTLREEKLVDNANKMGQLLRQALIAELPKDFVKEVRGMGLYNVIEFRKNFTGDHILPVFLELLCNGILVKPPSDGLIRLCPPLIILEHQIMFAVDVIKKALFKVKPSDVCDPCEVPKQDVQCVPKKRSPAEEAYMNKFVGGRIDHQEKNEDNCIPKQSLDNGKKKSDSNFKENEKCVQGPIRGIGGDPEIMARLRTLQKMNEARFRRPAISEDSSESEEFVPIESADDFKKSYEVLHSTKKKDISENKKPIESSFMNLELSSIEPQESDGQLCYDRIGTNKNINTEDCIEPNQYGKRSPQEDCVEPNQNKNRFPQKDCVEPNQNKNRSPQDDCVERNQNKNRFPQKDCVEPNQNKNRSPQDDCVERNQNKNRFPQKDCVEPNQNKNRSPQEDCVETNQNKKKETEHCVNDGDIRQNHQDLPKKSILRFCRFVHPPDEYKRLLQEKKDAVKAEIAKSKSAKASESLGKTINKSLCEAECPIKQIETSTPKAEVECAPTRSSTPKTRQPTGKNPPFKKQSKKPESEKYSNDRKDVDQVKSKNTDCEKPLIQFDSDDEICPKKPSQQQDCKKPTTAKKDQSNLGEPWQSRPKNTDCEKPLIQFDSDDEICPKKPSQQQDCKKPTIAKKDQSNLCEQLQSRPKNTDCEKPLIQFDSDDEICPKKTSQQQDCKKPTTAKKDQSNLCEQLQSRPKNTDCEKPLIQFDSDDEICPKKTSQQQDCKKPTTAKKDQSNLCEQLQSRPLECKKPEQRQGNGRPPNECKDQRNVKKFYPDDFQLPSGSKGNPEDYYKTPPKADSAEFESFDSFAFLPSPKKKDKSESDCNGNDEKAKSEKLKCPEQSDTNKTCNGKSDEPPKKKPC